jgi:uncharacterized protein (DUF1330 family)
MTLSAPEAIMEYTSCGKKLISKAGGVFLGEEGGVGGPALPLLAVAALVFLLRRAA